MIKATSGLEGGKRCNPAKRLKMLVPHFLSVDQSKIGIKIAADLTATRTSPLTVQASNTRRNQTRGMGKKFAETPVTGTRGLSTIRRQYSNRDEGICAAYEISASRLRSILKFIIRLWSEMKVNVSYGTKLDRGIYA
jgi:hypothetical protein